MWVAILFTLEQFKTGQCAVSCHFIGFDDGYYADKMCLCISKRDYEEIVNRKRIILPKKAEKIEQEKTSPYWRNYPDRVNE